MNLMNIVAIILVGTFALSLAVSYPMMSVAQQQPSTGQQSQEQIDVPLNFSLKVKDGEDKNATEGGKDVTVTVNVQDSEGGSPAKVPLTAKLPNDTKTEDIELCASLKGGKEMCQSLEQVVKAQGQNPSCDTASNESSGGSGNSTDKNEDNEDN
jgi:hypothetical protein